MNQLLYFLFSPFLIPAHQSFFSMVNWVTTQTHSDTCWPIRNGGTESLQRPCLACGKQLSILKQTLNTIKLFQKLSKKKIANCLPREAWEGGTLKGNQPEQFQT